MSCSARLLRQTFAWSRRKSGSPERLGFQPFDLALKVADGLLAALAIRADPLGRSCAKSFQAFTQMVKVCLAVLVDDQGDGQAPAR